MVGAIAFAIGVWGVVVGSDYSVITGDETVSAAALLLVGGVITFAVAAIGIVGACAMWKPLLLIVSFISTFLPSFSLSYLHIILSLSDSLSSLPPSLILSIYS